jgi:DNA-binding transcriptional LysR family regulator
MVLVVPAGHPLIDRVDAELADAAGERWIAGCPRCRVHLVTAAASQGFRPDIRHSTDDYVVTQTLVAAGLGVALLPALALEAAQTTGVATISLPRYPPRRISLNDRPGIPPSKAVQTAITALLKVTRDRPGTVR